jgi:membrane protein required for colicin V production
MLDFGSTNLATLNFNYFDVTLGAIIIILSVKGFMSGFVKELFGLLGLVGGVFVASRMSDDAAKFIDINIYHLSSPSALQLIGFISILGIIWGICVILGILFSKLTDASGLSFINRILGLVVGGGKYFLIFALIITALSNIQLVKDNLLKYVDNSKLYPHFKQVGSILINATPSMMEKRKIVETNTTTPPSQQPK